VKICDLTQFYSPVSGGVRRYLSQKADYIRAHRPDCQHVLVVPGETTGNSGDATARVYTIASPLISRTSRYRALLKLHLVEEVLEREQPDIIESGDPYQLAWKVVASGKGLGIPTVGFYHSHFPEALLRTVRKFAGRVALSIAAEVSRRYVTALYNKFHATLVPSPALVAELAEWGVERMHSIDLGVDIETFSPTELIPAALRAPLGLPVDKKLLLYVGRLASEKNVATLFEAFRILHAKDPGFCLLVVGDGTQRSGVERLRAQVGDVIWIPYCGSSIELASIYRAADLFVHPGIQETFGLVTLESQACGTPVVGIRGSYMDRIVFSDQFHWAAENSPAALADAIEGKFSEDLRSRGLEASRIVRSQYSWENVFAKIFRVYENVIGGFQ